MAQQAALQPPDGVQSDFANKPNSLRPIIYPLGAICIFMTISAVLIRMYTRKFIMKKIQLEDVFCSIAGLVFLIYLILGLLATVIGAGAHMWDLTTAEATRFYQGANSAEIIYVVAMLFLRLAILLQLLHIFVPTKKSWASYTLYALLALNTMSYVSLFLVRLLQCIPREKIWDQSVPGTCIDIYASFIVSGTVNVASDFSILLFPIITISQLRIEWSRKLAITGIFGIGILACICSIMRLVTSIKESRSPDQSYQLKAIALWSCGEMTSGILVNCLPVFPRFMQSFRKSSTTQRSSDAFTSSYVASKNQRSTPKPPWNTQDTATTVSQTLPNKWPRTRLQSSKDTGWDRLDGDNHQLHNYDTRISISEHELLPVHNDRSP